MDIKKQHKPPLSYFWQVCLYLHLYVYDFTYSQAITLRAWVLNEGDCDHYILSHNHMNLINCRQLGCLWFPFISLHLCGWGEMGELKWYEYKSWLQPDTMIIPTSGQFQCKSVSEHVQCVWMHKSLSANVFPSILRHIITAKSQYCPSYLLIVRSVCSAAPQKTSSGILLPVLTRSALD